MRFTRSAKYRKKYKKIFVLGQIILIWYALVFSISLLTTETAAYFSNYSTAHTSISTASYWWDKSDLEIVDTTILEFEDEEFCLPVVIQASLKNKGIGMVGNTEYEVLYSSDADVINNGDIIYTGVIEPLEADAITLISFEASTEGYYVFKVYQRDGYNHNYEERFVVWSNVNTVVCPEVGESDEEVVVDPEETKEGQEEQAKEQDGDEQESIEDEDKEKSKKLKEDKKVEDKNKDKEEGSKKDTSPKGEQEKEQNENKSKDLDKEKKEDESQTDYEEKGKSEHENDIPKNDTDDTKESNEDEELKQDGE